MKKVGIITLLGYRNYGNRLQNYAVQEVLRKFGFDGDTILHSIYEGTNKEKALRRIRALIRNPLSFGVKRFSDMLLSKSMKLRKQLYVTPEEKVEMASEMRIMQLYERREKKFTKFVDDNINETLSGIKKYQYLKICQINMNIL